MPSMSRTKKGLPQVAAKDIPKEFVRVDAKYDDKSKSVIYIVDGREVKEDQLETAIAIGVAEKRTKLLIAPEDSVSWDAVIKIIARESWQGRPDLTSQSIRTALDETADLGPK